MVLIPSVLSGIWSGVSSLSAKAWGIIALCLILVVSGVYVYTLRSSVVTLQTNNSALAAKNAAITLDLTKANKNNIELKQQAKEDGARLNAYQAVLGDADVVLALTKAKMDKDAKREATVAKKPGLVTIKTKKSYNNLEKEFQCISGQLDACYSAPSSPAAGDTPKKVTPKQNTKK
jgi:cytochrome c biogenesis factor